MTVLPDFSLELSTQKYNQMYQFNRRLIRVGFVPIVASASQQSTIWCYADLFIVVNPENAFILFHNRTINYENVIYACSNQDFILNLLKNRINIK